MRPVLFSFVMLSATSGLAAQYFLERDRGMYPESWPSTSGAGGNALVIDENGDGHLDVFAGAQTFQLYRNDGRGRFAYVAAGASQTSWVQPQAIGDYDGDGRADFCTGTRLFRNQGGGVFAVDPSISVYSFVETAGALADFDGDGDLDWMPNAFGLRLFANDGAGAFTEVTAVALAGLQRDALEFHVVDIDADGDPDVVKCSGGFGPVTLQVWRNLGNGTFASESLPTPAGLGAFSAVKVADFDGDGALEIAISAQSTPSGGVFVTWMVDAGSGVWQTTPMTFSGGLATDVMFSTVGDWNVDGRADWVTRAGVFQQTAPLQFILQAFPGGSLPATPMLVDLDADGRLDAIAAGAKGYLRNLASGAMSSERPWVVGLESSGGSQPPLRRLDFRRRGSEPIGDYVVSSLNARLGSDAPLMGVEERALRFTTNVASGSVLVSGPVGMPLGLMAPSGASFQQITSGGLVAAVAPNPAVLTWSVEAADLDGQPGDEVVFSSYAHPGPMIFRQTVAGWVDVSPVVSTPAPYTAQTHEQILLVDVDGDGDRDIVHESRVLRNDQTAWVEVASFASLVPPSATCMAAVDCDGDGDLDLVLGAGAGNSRLLLQVSGGFVNGTATWLPAGLAAVTQVSVGDVDGDGLPDVVLVIAGRSHLLRNTGSTFTMVPDIGPGGLLVDLDYDGRLDLFAGNRVLWNSRALLWATGPAIFGSWPLRFHMRQPAGAYVPGVLLLSSSETVSEVPGVGTLYVDPAGVVAVDLPVVLGAGAFDVPIPSSAAVVGLPLRAQAVVWNGNRFEVSNLVRDGVL
jgi:hypothetical protein